MELWAVEVHYEWAWTEWESWHTLASALVIATLGTALAWWLYHRERGAWGLARLRWARGLRIAAWVMLAVILLGPAWVRVDQRAMPPTVVVLRDQSQSLGVVDRGGDGEAAASVARAMGVSTSTWIERRATRAESLNEFFSRDQQSRWRQLFRVASPRLVGFDTKLHPTVDAVEQWTPLVPTGNGTDVAAALRQTLARESPAAIVLLTDGRSTVASDARAAAREAGQRGIAVHVVGVGESLSTRLSRIAAVHVRRQVWKDEPFEMEVACEFLGSPGDTTTLAVTRRNLDAVTETSTKVASLQLNVLPEQPLQRHSFQLSEAVAGRYEYVVRIEPLAGEVDVADNEQISSPVTVLERDRLRVLVIAGEPTWDFRQVERWLGREAAIESTCWLQSAEENRRSTGTRPLAELPATAEELLWYDVVFLLDPDPERLPGEWANWIRRFLGEHAGGLLYQPGPRHGVNWTRGLLGAALEDVWPVRLGAGRASGEKPTGRRTPSNVTTGEGQGELADVPVPAVRAWPARWGIAQRDHELLGPWNRVRDASAPERRAATNDPLESVDNSVAGEMGDAGDGPAPLDVYWTFPTLGKRPLARVLLEHGDPSVRDGDGPRPLLAVGRHGASHVAYLGFTGIWRAGPEDSFAGERRDEFWRRLARFLAEGRAWEGHRRGWLEVDREQLEPGESIRITVSLQDAAGMPLTLEAISGSVREETGQAVAISLAPRGDAPGVYTATWTPPREGTYEARVDIPESVTPESAESASLAASFRVELRQGELLSPWLDDALLRDIGDLSGGGYYRLDQWEELISRLPAHREVIVHQTAPRTLWDSAWVLLGMVALLGGEWWLRKRQGRM